MAPTTCSGRFLGVRLWRMRGALKSSSRGVSVQRKREKLEKERKAREQERKKQGKPRELSKEAKRESRR